jgi:hypothetical protein
MKYLKLIKEKWYYRYKNSYKEFLKMYLEINSDDFYFDYSMFYNPEYHFWKTKLFASERREIVDIFNNNTFKNLCILKKINDEVGFYRFGKMKKSLLKYRLGLMKKL